ncbi:hypothetical protein ND861_07820 [Leptospira sp. 2 VSF19]|uniref:Uncharacterized protein n=1 Tax=Leptospira soteropolitanensis TaxID=2950025 RepID=A0AAW5V9N4_9LEPT|nr:hypothetical protein [Leptospira soteropolitanensis]MCW7492902.1 hypothetical protein [Leptospira soteropolitanensis]MCW7500137.1 hypothetical protein [Leptospira soteropolitanensis]MCW7522388.1 hypothetical protein [Leptospira soteropolitanensis]MCW7526244.1 hypothetical protein [Leptospira soteropolitanensis]MCW7529644.1 hypothetical protein [Leptospira soteropolitanensis]
MLTTLMMLLGLSGTGADLKEIAGSEGGTRPSQDLSPRQRRRQKQKQAEEIEETQPRPKQPKIERQTKGGRGQELNFQTDPKEPKSKPKPLSERGLDFETDDDYEKNESDVASSEKEPKQGRSGRREKQKAPKSLSDLPLGEFGEESSESSSSGERQRREKPDISFSADDIISKNSKYSFHRRPLLNAEALVEAEQVEEAIEIFERTGNRIPDQEIKEKIKKNIQDLEEFLEDNPPPEKGGEPGKVEKPKKKDSKSGGQTKPDKDLTDLVSALKEVSELFAESIARAIQFAQSSQPPNFPQSPQLPSQNVGSPAPIIPPNRMETPQQGGKPPVETPISTPQVNQNVAGGNQLVHPIVYQFLQSSPQAPGFDPKVIQNQDQLLQSLNQGLTSGGLAGALPGTPMAPPGSGIVGPFYVPPDIQGQPGLPGVSGSPGQAGFPKKPIDLQALADQISKKDVSELDLPEDTFFSSDWKQFKDLPLVDRRSGEERRKNPDRRTNLAGRKDRRSGEDRRKKDRFHEREEFLKNQALKKIEKKAKELEAQGEETSLNDLLKPYFPDQPNFKLSEDWGLETINLPDPNDLRRDEKEPQLHPHERSLEEEPNWLEATTDSLRKELELPDPVDPQTDKLIKPKSEPKEQADSNKSETIIETDVPIQVELTNRPLTSEDLRIGLPDADEVFRERKKREEAGLPEEEEGPSFEDAEAPEIEIVDGNLGEIAEEESPIPLDEMAEKATEEEPEKIIHGVLELKPPEADDAPFLTLTYDFGKIPHAFRLSKNYSIMEYSYYKYKPMLMKAQEFARRKMLKNALNYYRVIKSQNIPPELRKMINRNIRDITEFMEKFLMAKGK